MNNLILDCSCGMNVYVVKNNEVFSHEDKIQNKHSDEVLKIIDKLLVDAGLSIHDIENIGVCVGPGSFTGVRVAVSVVKGLAIGNNAKVYVLSNFDIFSTESQNYVLVLDGFSNLVYARISDLGEVKDCCIEIEKLVSSFDVNDVVFYHTTEKTQNLLNKFKISSKMAKNEIISAFNRCFSSESFTELNKIYPVYLRASQAEIEREKRKNG